MSTSATETPAPEVENIPAPSFGMFIARCAQAHAYLFSLTVDEVQALPPKVLRGIAVLQSAFRNLAEPGSDEAAATAVRAAHFLDPIKFVHRDQPPVETGAEVEAPAE